MAAAEKTYDVSVSPDWKQYLAGAVDCLADGPGGRCARLVVLLAAGDLSPCLNAAGVNRALTGLPNGYKHVGHIQSFTSTAACIVYW